MITIDSNIVSIDSLSIEISGHSSILSPRLRYRPVIIVFTNSNYSAISKNIDTSGVLKVNPTTGRLNRGRPILFKRTLS